MKNLKRFTAFILTLAIVLSAAAPAGEEAATFDTLDANTAVAGASVSLRHYFETNENAAVLLSELLSPVQSIEEDPELLAGSGAEEEPVNEDIFYDEPVVGVAYVESFLNVRSAPTALSDIVEGAIRGADIIIRGERIVGDKKWYIADIAGVIGYVSATYVLFGDEAQLFKAQVAEEQKDPKELPTEFKVTEDLASIPEEAQTKLKKAAAEVNFVLQNDYPTALEQNNTTDLYFIFVYLLEQLQTVQDIAEEYGLSETFSMASSTSGSVELNRAEITETTGTSDQDFFDDLSTQKQQEAAAAQAEADRLAEAARQAAEAEEAERLRQEAEAAQARANEANAAAQEEQQQMIQEGATESSTELGRAIADFAASWVGKIHYGWGADAFYEGGYVDCSHFTYHVFLQFGLVSSYTYSGGQRGWGYAVDISQIQPGDLVCYNGHVAIYYGNGLVVHAPSPGRDIEIGSLYLLPVQCVRRLY